MLISISATGQLNTDRITAIGRNALYFEDYVLSIQYFNQVIKVKPYLAEPYLYRAIAKIQLSDYRGAELDCDNAIANNPFMPGAYYTRGFVYRQLGNYQKAVDDYTSALQFAPENKTYMLMRADALVQLEQYEQALSDIEFLIKREPHTASLYFEKGIISLSTKDTLVALDCFTKTTELDSQNPANWSALGHVNLLLERDNDALLALTKAINLGSKWAGDYINRGIIFYRNHNYRGAISDYDKAVEKDPQNSQCYYNRGLLRQEVGDLNRALEDFNKALDIDPENTDIHYQRGVVNLQLRQWKDAIDDFDQLIQKHPYFLPSYYLAAQAYSALGDEKQAYSYQHKADQLEKDKDKIKKDKPVNTEAQIADAQPQNKDNRKQFSQRAAQNQSDNIEDKHYDTESRGAVQNKYADVINEPAMQLTYYAQPNTLRRTNYYHLLVEQINASPTLPSPLKLTTQEVPLTAQLISRHFEAIDRLSYQIDGLPVKIADSDKQQVAVLFLSRAVEFAMVQDYSSAIDDCTRAITLSPDMTLAFFCRANWRQKLAEYQRLNADNQDKSDEKTTLEQKYGSSLILRDYDYALKLTPDFAFAYYNKANILCSQKDFAAAIESYTSAINIDGDFAEAYFNRGLTYVFIGETEKGILDLSKAGELGIYQAYNLITRFK